tara:strand:+ start:951 stop:1352 length:402 start_codon:yes stop_codon:yes gene_type:complete
MEWWLQLLLFAFGYVTCKTFYFLRAAHTSVSMLKVSQLLSLAMLARSMENFTYSKTLRLHYLDETKASDQNKKAFMLLYADEVKNFKTKSIAQIVELHPNIFKDSIDFTDWSSGMKFLNEHQDAVQTILRGKE